mgnify:CR=1 FL=1
MLKEIFEIPEVLERISDLKFSPKTKKLLNSAKRIFLVGSGSSYHAGFLGRHFFESVAGVEAEAWVASEWNLNPPEFRKGDLAILISQSGGTAEIVSALKTARELKVPILALVNRKNSTLAKKADQFIDILAGAEKAVPATKSFVAEVAVLVKLALFCALFRGRVSAGVFKRLESQLTGLGQEVEPVLDRSLKIKSITARYKSFGNFIVAGSGTTLPLAYELALKLKETAGVHAEGMPLGEVRHGPMALAQKRFAFVLLVDSADAARARELATDLKKTGSKVLVWGDKKFPASDSYLLPKGPQIFSPFTLSAAFLLFSYWLGVGRGINVDKPQNLTKSVIVR